MSQSELVAGQSELVAGQSELSAGQSEPSAGQIEPLVNHDAPSSDIDLSWRMRDREALLLADSMRASRLTLLHSDPGVTRSELLRGGVLPLLRRRASDSVGDEDRESRVVIPFSDRRLRRTGRSSTRLAERVVWFDGWGAQPLAALRAAILGSLPDDAITYARSTRLGPMLAELSRRFDAQFLIMLDSFERFWDPALKLDDAEQFIDEFSEAVNSDGLRAHFLLSVETLGEPRLDALRQRIDGFDASALHLTRWQSITTAAAAPRRESARAMAAAPPSGVVLPVLQDAVPSPPVLMEAAALPARLRLPESTPPSLLAPAPAPAQALPPATALPPAAAKTTRRPRPLRSAFVAPEPIRTEGVYAFIESTLQQTASDFAPWRDAGDAPEPVPDCSPPQTASFGPRRDGTDPVTRFVASARVGAKPGSSSVAAAANARVEPFGLEQVDDDNRSSPVLAWARRLFRRS